MDYWSQILGISLVLGLFYNKLGEMHNRLKEIKDLLQSHERREELKNKTTRLS